LRRAAVGCGEFSREEIMSNGELHAREREDLALHVERCAERYTAVRAEICGLRKPEILAPFHQAFPIRSLATILPCLAQHRVAEGFQILGLALRGLPIARDLLPGQPANRGIKRRDMKADRVRVLGRRCRAPFAGGEHRRLVMLLNRRVALLTMVAHAVWVALLPDQAFEFQPLHGAALRTGQEIAPLVGRSIFPFNPAAPSNGRG
jgi:hypothetical protein